MTNNMDEFDPEGLETTEQQPSRTSGMRQNLSTAWHTQPLFKLLAIMVVVAIAIAGALMVSSGSKPTETSTLVNTPSLSEVPGGKASPYFGKQNEMAGENRVKAAIEEGGSAMPMPIGQTSNNANDLRGEQDDPLNEYRAETERIRMEMQQKQQQQALQLQQMQQQMQQQQRPPEVFDESLSQAMQRQMSQLTESWVPKNMKLVAGAELPKEGDKTTTPANVVTADAVSSNAALPSQQPSTVAKKAFVSAGTVSYAQLLTEANSDVPGPILLQIVSGPLSGARAVGQFRVADDYLILEFTLATLKGKDYSIRTLALDPDTTLGGMATEVDHRYFTRVILPAAGSFVSTFGTTLGQGSSQTTATNGVIISDQARKSVKEAIYSGVGQAGQSIQQFLQQEANNTKALVRVAAGTPMGLFFLTSVQEDGSASTTNNNYLPGYVSGIAGAYGNMAGQNYGYGVPQAGLNNSYSSGYSGASGGGLPSGGLNNGYNGYNASAPGYTGYQQQLGNGTTIITPGQQSPTYYNR